MTRRTLAVVGAVAVLGVVAAGAFGAFGALGAIPSWGRSADVPTAPVERRDFEHWVTAEGVLRAAESTPLTVPPQAPGRLRIAWIAPEGTRLEAGDVAVRFDPTEMERTVADRRADLAINDLRLDQQEVRSGARLENLDRDAAIARRELEHSREFASKDELIFSRMEIVESQIDQELAAERLEQAEGGREREEAIAESDRDLLAIERRKLGAELRRAEETLEAMEVRAPHAGFLIYRRNWRGDPPRVGDTVFRGYPLAEIPRPGAMEVEAYVLEADAGGLSEDDRARVHLEAHPGVVHEARVASVEAVAKPRHRASPVQYFAVTLELEQTDPERMKAGQRVQAEILMERLSGVLTVPRQAVFDDGGARRVYRRADGGFERVEVATGGGGRGRLVVEGELEAGDRVALRDPTAPEEEPVDEEDEEPADRAAPTLPGNGPGRGPGGRP